MPAIKSAPAAEAAPTLFKSAKAFEAWLKKHHAKSDGLWLKIAKRGAAETKTGHLNARLSEPSPSQGIHARSPRRDRDDDSAPVQASRRAELAGAEEQYGHAVQYGNTGPTTFVVSFSQSESIVVHRGLAMIATDAALAASLGRRPPG